MELAATLGVEKERVLAPDRPVDHDHANAHDQCRVRDHDKKEA
jgi:hypothetical protein